GVGYKTRREITEAARRLRQRLGTPSGPAPEPEAEPVSLPAESAETLQTLSVDQLLERLRRGSGREGDTLAATLQVYLDIGLDGSTWLSQSDIARYVSVTRARIGQIIAKFQQRWKQDSAVSLVRDLLAETVAGHGGVLSLREATDALLVARGCAHDEPVRTAVACAVIRAAVEAERT
ncbi:MAG: BREX system serine/threonine kinase PglW, partial [Planctomycetaceae bacterium]